MARAVTKESSLPKEALISVDRVSALGFTWSYVQNHLLADTGKRVQVRDEEALAPLREVSKYATDLERGDVMPPVIMTADGYLVDGATRTEAARKNKMGTFPAVVLDVNYEGAPSVLVDQLVTLGAVFNITHGRGLSPRNIENIVKRITDADSSPREVSRRLHISEATATTIINTMKATRKAAQLGVPLDGSLTTSQMKTIGGKISKYTDPVMGELIAFMQDARLSTDATASLCRRLEAESTETARFAILAAERDSYREVMSGQGSPAPSRAAKLRQSLGYVINQEDPDKLVEISPGARDAHLKALYQAKEKLEKVIAAQLAFHRSQATGD